MRENSPQLFRTSEAKGKPACVLGDWQITSAHEGSLQRYAQVQGSTLQRLDEQDPEMVSLHQT
jgi:hypothetical protein